ncbi:diguanylate cyclase domain-containing protein [Methylophilus aquaticus]|uniref:Diguanylate cyclase n=1 Tax=Methylophilus aquaticus TaxID=1971610 RepID=A0ABT9JTE7_9PROT|nr:diguanylate cyclase [Methylophilus aquaticus]MDP8567867.1 diguanylate cyclase [Methylophilus aquaticus]
MIGDEVLLLLSRLMQQTFRDGDLLFRFGGEAFVGVFSCAEKRDIIMLLNMISTSTYPYTFPQVGQISISTGCCKKWCRMFY